VVAANMARTTTRKKKRKRGDGDDDVLLAALQKLYYGGCTLKMLTDVVKNLKSFLQEKYKEPILTCLKTITSTFDDMICVSAIPTKVFRNVRSIMLLL